MKLEEERVETARNIERREKKDVKITEANETKEQRKEKTRNAIKMEEKWREENE